MLICCAAAILAAVAQTAQKCIGSHGENILKGYLLVLSPTYNRRFFFSIRIVYLRNSLRKVVDNYYNENCAGMARRVENFRGEFVKKRGIPAIAHASVSPAFT